MKTIAVISKPEHGNRGEPRGEAKEPLKIRNSPMNPFRPGRPNDENIATLIQPQSKRRALHQSAEIIEPARPRRCSSNPTK